MTTIHRDQLLHQLNWRYATKQFDPQRKIGSQDWAALEEALVLTPSSFGLQPWKFIVVTNPTVKEKLVAASWGQRQVTDCSHLVVFAIKQDLGEKDIDAYLDRIAEVRGAPRETLAGFRDLMIGSIVHHRDQGAREAWATRQVYLALGNFLTSAALLGIDACPMEGIDPVQYDKILDLDQRGLTAVVAAAAGYRAASDQYAALKKVRFPRAQVLVAV
ncbi:MAG: NAD(P)H-dependent oxidoreductase [Opitutaceae bacterium]|nr:NAD(P)H-dependent oxidoreductase [Opitutaceae bacterium]